MTCPNVVPVLAFDHVFVAEWLLAKALSRLFLYRTHLAVCCHDISRPAAYPDRQGIQLCGYDYTQGVSAEKKKRISRLMRIPLYQYPDREKANCS